MQHHLSCNSAAHFVFITAHCVHSSTLCVQSNSTFAVYSQILQTFPAFVKVDHLTFDAVVGPTPSGDWRVHFPGQCFVRIQTSDVVFAGTYHVQIRWRDHEDAQGRKSSDWNSFCEKLWGHQCENVNCLYQLRTVHIKTILIRTIHIYNINIRTIRTIIILLIKLLPHFMEFSNLSCCHFVFALRKNYRSLLARKQALKLTLRQGTYRKLSEANTKQ